MKKLLILLVLFLGTLNLHAQPPHELMKDFRKIVLFKGGDSTTIYVNTLFGNMDVQGTVIDVPWEWQNDILAVPLHVVPEITTKVKGKFYKRFKVKDYEGYVFNGDVYHSVNIKASAQVGDNWVFLKLEKPGKINLYKYYYDQPIDMHIPSGSPEDYLEMAQHYRWIFSKANNPKRTAKYVYELSAKKDVADCPVVQEKLKNDTYAQEIQATKLMGLYSNPAMTKFKLLAIEEYNKICK